MSDEQKPVETPAAVVSDPTGTNLPAVQEDAPKQVGRIRANVSQALMEKEHVSIEDKTRCLATSIFTSTKQFPFLGSIMQCLNISYGHTIPTAGIMFNSELKRWDMIINPKFFCHKLQDPERVAILLHELSHITHKHPLRVPFLKISPRKRMIMNIAADMAINQFIKNLPKGCQQCPAPNSGEPCKNELCPGRAIMVEDFFDTDDNGVKIPWPERKSMEFYYEKLLTRFDDPENDDDEDGDGEGDGEGEGEDGDGKGKPSKGKGKGKGKPGGNAGGGAQTGDLPDTIDEHLWDGSAEEKDMLDATEELVKRAMIKQRWSYDDLPGYIKELLEEIKSRREELNYKGLINSAIKKHASGHNRKHVWTRKSRRFGNKAPGTKIGDLPKLHMYIDTSGSISIEEANEFLEIVDNFLKAGARKCRLNLWHTALYYGEEYKLGSRLDRGMIQSGGTDLTECMKDIAKRKPDLAIFLTDGYFGDVNVESMLPPAAHFPQCLFIISKQGTVDHPLKRLGETIKIPDTTKK